MQDPLCEKVRLVFPTPEHADAIEAFRQEFIRYGGDHDGMMSLIRLGVDGWFKQIELCKKPETCPPVWVPTTQFICLRESDGKMVGAIQVRHCFNEFLEKYAGHIGYSVCPTERRKGYATKMLHDVLPYCKNELGLDRVLVCCLNDNEASRRTILKNGGVYESTVFEPQKQVYLERYRIET